MKKLLQFLSIGILSSSAVTSLTACNNNNQKNSNLNKRDEQQKENKVVQNKEFEIKKQLIKELDSKNVNDSKNKQSLPIPVKRKRELIPIPAPRNKREAISLENQEQDLVTDKENKSLDVIIEENENLADFDLVDEYIEDNQQELDINKENDVVIEKNENLAVELPDKKETISLENQEQDLVTNKENKSLDVIIEENENLADFDLVDEYIEDNQQELLIINKEQDYQKELTIEEIINNMKELNDKLEREYETLLSEQALELAFLNKQQEVISNESIKKDSEITLRTDESIEDVNIEKQKLDKKIRTIKTLSDNLENREKELLSFQEEINQKQKTTIKKLEDNFSEISKKIRILEEKPKRKIGVIIDNIYHDDKEQKTQLDINLNKDKKNLESSAKQEKSIKKPSLSKYELKKNLDRINKVFKLELTRNRFYIKGGKDVTQAAKEKMLTDVFLPIFSKLPNYDNYKYRIILVTADNSETQHIQYIIETKLKKPGTNKPIDFRLGYATVNVDWVTLNKTNLLIKEFKSKLENKLLKTEFKITKEQSEKAASFIKEQTDKIINKLNKEKKYSFIFEDTHLFIFKNQEFQLNLKISKPLPNSLSNLTEESVSIKLAYKIIE